MSGASPCLRCTGLPHGAQAAAPKGFPSVTRKPARSGRRPRAPQGWGIVINERVRTGDKINFKTDPPELSVDVRFYLGNPCDYDEPPVGDPANEKKGCALQHQVFPVTDSKGFTAESATASTDEFTVPAPTGACGPSGCPNYRLLYMGIRLKEGPCQADYTLSAQITRAPGNEIY